MDSSFHLVVDLPTYVRFNPLKADSPSRYFASLRTKGFSFRRVSFLSSGFICEGKRAIGATTPYLQGIFHVQEAASQVPAEVLFSLLKNRRSLLLDMCAAPGGKTSQLAALFQDSSILALDSSSDRMVALHHNLDRLGAAQVVTKLLDARETPSLKLSFDGILLDAPCSGNYAIEKHYFAKRTIAGVKKNSLLQKELIQAAFSSLKSGGVLVYATCSLEPEENEEVVDWFLKKTAGEMRLERIPFREGSPGLTSFQGKSYDSSLALAKRFWPHRHKTQGFFVAAMRRL
ncbi:MAG: RsmB/NOP family class I SAM-dependent RNA methyltransferase [Candidatus Woesearchaeota archaeon]|nr:MAG: RsmB/NOP family class I SAM-dependent RNA methyltransferase [Candidatus Woesearchaeota archaeon]